MRQLGELGRCLVAWVRCSRQDVTIADLGTYLRERLPPNSVPTRIECIDHFPFSSNGKLDSKRLILKGSEERDCESQLNPVQSVFARVLGLVEVGPGEDFFGLGGHSIAAQRAAALLRDEFNVPATVTDIMNYPTAHELGPMLAHRKRDEVGIAEVKAPSHRRVAPQQLALWTVWRMDPSDTTYNLPVLFRIRGALDPERLRRALALLVERHEALRTSYPEVAGRPVASVRESADLHVSVHEVRTQAESDAVVIPMVLKPFDLDVGPLLRAAILLWAPDECTLALCIHHIAFDGHSARIIADELATVLNRGSVEPRPVGYGTYASGANDRLDDRRATPPPILLPPNTLGLPRHTEGEDGWKRAAVATQVLSREAASGVTSVAKAHKLTPFGAIVAAWAIVLSRLDEDDVIHVAIPLDMRDQASNGRLVGNVVNTGVVELDVSSNSSTASLFDNVRTQLLALASDSEWPYAEQIRQGRKEYGAHFAVRTMVTLDDYSSSTRGEVSIVREHLRLPAATFDLDLNIVVGSDGKWCADLHHDVRVCSAEQAGALLDQLQHVLLRLGDAPLGTLNDLDPLPPNWAARIQSWAAPEVTRPTAPIHHAFVCDAEQRPESLAIRGVVRITRGNLERRSRALAANLKARGVGVGDVIAVGVTDKAQMVAAWLATIRAGAALAPYDPEWPSMRIAEVVQATGALLVVSDDGITTVGSGTGAEPITANLEVPSLFADAPVDPLDLAYLVATSGTSGTPRIVAIGHGALANHASWMAEQFLVSGQDRVLLHTSSGFDVAIWEVLGALAAGAELVVADAERIRDISYLVDTVVSEGVTILQVVPSLLRALLDQECLSRSSLRAIFCGGEEMSSDLPALFSDILPRARLFNMYGPTEATIDATWQAAEHRTIEADRVPIGRPAAGVSTYVLDQRLRRLPPWARGELSIGGAGVALGYVGDPVLTASRFIPDPYSLLPGARMYMTGDSVRMRGDGAIEFLGRSDQQVKVRGHRIEIAEVEAILMSMPSVRQAAVVLVTENRDVRRLVAVVQPMADVVLDEDQLRSHVVARLPRVMVPSSFSVVGTLPLTSNGKLDRRALVSLARTVRSSPAGLMGPSERVVAATWNALIGGPWPQASDRFFEIGGDSLLVLQLRARLSEAFGVSLKVQDLFEHNSVRMQATFLDSLANSSRRPRQLWQVGGEARRGALERLSRRQTERADGERGGITN